MTKANIWSMSVPVESVMGNDGRYDYAQALKIAQTIANITKPIATFEVNDPILVCTKFDESCCDPANCPKYETTANGIKWPYRTIMLMEADGTIMIKVNG